jgi:flagellar basal-body rod protein FlgF
MDPISISAASGMRARMESLDMLANNLANASTGGYKSDREFYSLYVSPEAADAGSQGTGPSADPAPVIERHWIDFAQGTMRNTGNAMDVALEGKGFFAVNGPSGMLFTRNGAFHLSAGGALATQDGYSLRGVDGKALQTQSSTPVDISSDGVVHQDGQTLGQLAVVAFDDTTALNKQGANYFYQADPQAKPVISTAEVHQGKLEDSNAGPAEAAVRLISVMRQFETMQKAVLLGEEMNRHAIEEVAKVTT